MKKTIILTSILTVFFFEFIYAQDDIQIGSPNATRPAATGALYDYSTPNTINIKVQHGDMSDFQDFISFLKEQALMNLFHLLVDRQRMQH